MQKQKKDGETVKLSDISQISYQQIKGDESELLDLIGQQSSEDEEPQFYSRRHK